jgi:beta-lactamase regulating signal transducer with metallopeptidase domain
MTIDSIGLLVRLVDTAGRALLLASCAGLVLIALKVRATSLRLATWTAVLYAALAMPLLGWLLPAIRVPAQGFLDHAVERRQIEKIQTAPTLSARQYGTNVGTGPSRRTGPDEVHPSFVQTSAPSDAVAHSRQSIPWSMLALSMYVAVALFLLVRFAVGIVFSGRLIRAGHAIHDEHVRLRLASRAYAYGMKFVPGAVESNLISVPVTMGVLRSTILLPTDWREWDEAKLNAVLTHEVSHVARRDALTQRLSLLHRAIFWFSPLSWWLHHQLAALAEQASDEAALSSGANRNDYARTLLGFFEALHASPGRVWWQGVSMATAGQAERRMERILAWKGVVTMGLKKSALVTMIALSVPVVYLAAAVRTVNAAPNDTKSPQSLAASPVAEAPSAPTAPNSALPAQETITGTVPPAGGTAVIQPIANVAPITPISSIAAIPPISPAWPYQSASSAGGTSYGRYSYSYDEPRFVIVTGNSDSMTMSGSSEDARHAQNLKKKVPGDFIWFERDERSYIIRDQATIDRARKLWAPQEELGKKQEELGKRQEALGKQQEELGKKMEQVQVKVPDMTAELDRLKAKLQKLGPSATMEQLGDLQSEIGDLQSKIGEVQSQAGEQQSKLGEQMGALGEQQGKLGEEQGKLGEQQGELGEQASHQMEQLLDEAIKNGKAQLESQTWGTGML